MSKRSEKKLNEIFKQHGFNPESEEKPINPRIKFEIDDPKVKVYKGSFIDNFNESNQEEKEILLLNYLRAKDSTIIDESELKKSNEPVYFYYDPVSGRHFQYIEKVRFRLAEDEQNILCNKNNIFKILNLIKPLASLILEDNFEQLNSSILENLSLLTENKSQIELEKLGIEIKFNLSHLITKTARIINEFLIKPQFTLLEFKSLLKTTTNKDKLTLVEKIDVSDISLILEGISQIFPELKKSFEVNYESPLSKELNYMVGGSPITSACKALRSKNDWNRSINGNAVYIHRKTTDQNSYIYHYINDFKNPQEINLLPYSEAEQILDKFGVFPALFHLILAVHFYRQSNPLSAVFHLRGTDLIKDLGLHKRKDLSTHQKLSKVLEIVTAVRSLIITAKWSSSVKVKSGKGYKTKPVTVNVEPSVMWDISPKTTVQKDLFGNEELNEIDIIVKSGAWLSHFFNEASREVGKSLYNFATFSRKILDLDPYHEELALRIALLQSTMDYRQYYTVEQWLIENLLGAKDRISKAKNDKVTRQQLTKLWNKTLQALERIGYTIHYDQRTYPPELRPTSPRKPRGYFERLLEAKIKLTPESLGKPQSEIEAKAEAIKIKPSLPETYSGQKLKETRLKSEVSPKQIAKYLKCSQGKIYNAEKRENLSKKLFKEIIDAINFIKKHPDKF